MVAELPVRDVLEPSRCHKRDGGLCAQSSPCSARRWQINTGTLIIKWLIVLAGPIEAAIYRAVGTRRIPLAKGKHFWQAARCNSSSHLCQNRALSNQELIEIQ